MTQREKTGTSDGRTDRLEELRRLVRQRLDERRRNPRLVPPDPPPRYDEVFWRGVEWLDGL